MWYWSAAAPSSRSHMSRFIVACLATLTTSVRQVYSQVATNISMDSAAVWWDDFWALRLAANLLGYATVALPIYLLVRYTNSKYRELPENEFLSVSCSRRLLILFSIGRPFPSKNTEHSLLESGAGGGGSHKAPSRHFTGWTRALLLIFCFFGLQFNYITWGWLQEMLMTQPYLRSDGSEIKDTFKDSQFLVFLNRFFAFVISGLYILWNYSSQPLHTAPFYKYSFASFANVMSSWCQYEALKYVTFPAQTICKASKIIPVMLMGKLVSGTKYPTHQYVTATVLALGVSVFLLSTDTVSGDHGKKAARRSVEVTTMSGIMLMCGYLLFDSFTPNWQAKLYAHKPRVSSFQMMCGVNMFSVLLCFVSLIEQGHLFDSVWFMFTHQFFMRDCLLLSAFGAVGQIFIYKTIDYFGPVVFTVIMTIRQMLSIVVSCLYYGHPISPLGVLGLLLAFSSLFFNTYIRQQHTGGAAKTKTVADVPTSKI